MGSLAWNGLNVMQDVNQYKQMGSSTAASLAKAGTMGAIRSTAPILGAAIDIAPMAVQGVVAANRFRREKAEDYYKLSHIDNEIGGYFKDTPGAQTMRQAAVQQIQGNKLNARSALGGEAKLFSPFANRR